ncbi:MAG: carbon starvation CstA 5TM domain-containing protein [Methanobacterium sp.]|nr:carbon starvation CstA 5TM domain-containing protein [Methanobacterium sp.]
MLTAVDTSTRVGRYLMQEIIEKFKKNPLGDSDRNKKLEIILTSLVFTFSWGYLLYTWDITTIWPLFGMCNQLLATCALIIGTTMLIRRGRAKYAWVTAGPGLFMLPVTLSAGYLNIVTNFLPKGLHLLAVISLIIMVLMAVIFIDAFKCWYDLLKDPKKQDYEVYWIK